MSKTVIWWFLYRRWRLIAWTKSYDKVARRTLVANAYLVNLCYCRDHRLIYKDMQRILK